VCPEEGCGAKISITTVKQVVERRDKDLLKKLEKFEKDIVDNDTRFCTRPGCDGRMKKSFFSGNKLTCPDCG
jgi:hypothetical protein